MKQQAVIVVCILTAFFSADIFALEKNRQMDELPCIVKGLSFAMDYYANRSYQKSGGNKDSSFFWNEDASSAKVEITFDNFSYYTAADNGEAGPLITFNGFLELDITGYNGKIDISGDVSITSLHLIDFIFFRKDDARLIADDILYTYRDFKEIHDSMDCNVITRNEEIALACKVISEIFQTSDWGDGGNLLNSIAGKGDMPGIETRTSNKNETLSAELYENGLLFCFTNYTKNTKRVVFNDVMITGELFYSFVHQGGFYNGNPGIEGSLKFKGLKMISSVELKNCRFVTSEENEENLQGRVYINDEEMSFRDFVHYVYEN